MPNTARLYRMPWTMSDNGFSWLEPTRRCNLTCEYCYQRNDSTSDKSLSQTEAELDGLVSLRKADAIIIAGGEPLVHPEILEVTRLVRARRVKPIILTNGHAVTPALIHELKRAGASGIFFHVDAGQGRPGWIGASERELNDLRQLYADMVAAEDGLACGFNTTILPETLHEVGDVVRWTLDNIHKVTANVLIPVRGAHVDDGWDYYAGAERLDVNSTAYGGKRRYVALSAGDLCAEIRRAAPAYRFHSYLGGTQIANAPKWLFGTHVGTARSLYGSLGPRSAELFQSLHHVIFGRYLAITRPPLNRLAWLLWPLTLVDRQLRSALWRRLLDVLRSPSTLFSRVSLQNLIVMQPHDVLPNGEQDECDGCPNKTFWNGRLVSECRQEDYLAYGRGLTAAPRRCAASRPAGEPAKRPPQRRAG